MGHGIIFLEMVRGGMLCIFAVGAGGARNHFSGGGSRWDAMYFSGGCWWGTESFFWRRLVVGCYVYLWRVLVGHGVIFLEMVRGGLLCILVEGAGGARNHFSGGGSRWVAIYFFGGCWG